MGSHWSVPHVVAVSVVLAVAILEGGATFRAVEGQTALTGPSVAATAVTSTVEAPSPAQSDATGSPSATDAGAPQPSAAAATRSAQATRTSQPSASARASATGSVTPRQDLAAEVAAAANAERAAVGLTPLTYTSCSVPAAWAVHLASVATLTHNSLLSVLSTCGGTATAGENIAVAYTTVADVTAGWMTSPDHQANILNSSFTSISVGVAQAPDGTYYWVQDFTG